MDIHKNARSCPASRELLVRRVLRKGWGVSQAAEAAGQARLKLRTCRPVLLTTAAPAGGLLYRRALESAR